MASNPALIYGPKNPPLCMKTLGAVVDDQAAKFGDRPAVVVPWQSVRLSYRDLAKRSLAVTKALLSTGCIRRGDCVGIMAGNCYQYVEVFLGAARIGCPVVVLNNTYTPDELRNAVAISSCRILFISPVIGTQSLQGHIDKLGDKTDLQHLITLDNAYTTFTSSKNTNLVGDTFCKNIQNAVKADDVLNLQFTSGTTGNPKAAMLTHINIVNNAQYVGGAMRLTPDDIICCPPPLFHCFGLIMGFLASIYYGSTIVFPSDRFHAPSVVDSILKEDATVLLGVPTMFVGELEVLAKLTQRPRRLRTGLAAGSAVPQALMDQLRSQMGVDKMLIAYGMTETSPVTFITSLDDSEEKRMTTIGRPMPHTGAKIVDTNGQIVARGQRGELCTSGFALQKGYWKNEAKTAEVMKRDEHGVLWMHTGDEVLIDDEGYGHITGRIKDIIIRGGENIYPREIEDRLMCHPAITEASVVGLSNERYGEVVGCFLKLDERCSRPQDSEVQKWVGEQLGRHKTPQHIFWIRDRLVGNDFPKTGSGKYQKHIMRDIGDRILAGVRAKL